MTKSHLHRRRAARQTGYDEGLAAGEAERNNLKGKYQSIVTLLDAARRRIQDIFDHLDDEGDRVYLASTNHRDWLRDMLDHMDRWSFDAMLPKGDINKMEADPYAEIRTQRARAEAAEAEVKRLRNKVAARALTDRQLANEIEAVDEACKGGFGEGGGSPGEWWYERADELEHERKRRELESQLHQHNSRTTLSSTGGEHHAE
ncbi:hypothetical protein G6L41_008845 [Agrobacterium tumefaciens]|uniref:hypothetical protein n=1 Tax=Agrobacterium tumefaciens TaxID=358 RepID=UPI001573CD2F|nr:hypothetical protein [Agrobacterium tumefaciens]WCK12375.1 hypothetical protein G6L41_008845 [Agrobacterium tumefaciens]